MDPREYAEGYATDRRGEVPERGKTRIGGRAPRGLAAACKVMGPAEVGNGLIPEGLFAAMDHSVTRRWDYVHISELG